MVRIVGSSPMWCVVCLCVHRVHHGLLARSIQSKLNDGIQRHVRNWNKQIGIEIHYENPSIYCYNEFGEFNLI